ncbi:MAG: hypothetical protein ABIC95_06565 [archaeon]
MDEKKRYLLLSVLLVVLGLLLALAFRNPYWYSFFILGIFLLFDWLDQHFNGHSLLDMIRHRLGNVTMIYFWFFVLGMVMDIMTGRLAGTQWHYQGFTPIEHVVHVWLIGYPVTFLAAYEVFQVIKAFFRPLSHHSHHVPLTSREIVFESMVVYGVFFFVLPLVARMIDQPHFTILLVISGILVVVGSDFHHWHHHKKDIWHNTIGIVGTIVVAGIIIGLLAGLPAVLGGGLESFLFKQIEIFSLGAAVIIPGWAFYVMTAFALEESLLGRKH